MKRISAAIVAAAVVSLVEVTTPAAQEKPAKKSAAEAKAEENFAKICQQCHGPEGKSPVPGMSLVDREWRQGNSVQQIAKTIAEGVPGTAMMPNKEKLTREEILALARLVRSFDPNLSSGKSRK